MKDVILFGCTSYAVIGAGYFIWQLFHDDLDAISSRDVVTWLIATAVALTMHTWDSAGTKFSLNGIKCMHCNGTGYDYYCLWGLVSSECDHCNGNGFFNSTKRNQSLPTIQGTIPATTESTNTPATHQTTQEEETNTYSEPQNHIQSEYYVSPQSDMSTDYYYSPSIQETTPLREQNEQSLPKIRSVSKEVDCIYCDGGYNMKKMWHGGDKITEYKQRCGYCSGRGTIVERELVYE